jgi:hypothetical protein
VDATALVESVVLGIAAFGLLFGLLRLVERFDPTVQGT